MITLTVEHLYKKFGRQTVLDNLSFQQTGGVTGIAGSNGSGKSTLLKCLAYLLRPTRGQLEWKRDDTLLERDQIRQMLGFAAPYINLYAELTPVENLAFLAQLRSINEEEAHIPNLLEYVQMSEFADHPYGSLSTGQKQRIKLASALLHKPQILFMDEPGSNLDKRGKHLVEDIVNDFRRDDRLTIIASNNPEELEWCDRVISVQKDGNR